MKRKRSKPTAAGVDEWRGRSFSIESRSLFTKSRFASNKLGKVLNKNKTWQKNFQSMSPQVGLCTMYIFKTLFAVLFVNDKLTSSLCCLGFVFAFSHERLEWKFAWASLFWNHPREIALFGHLWSTCSIVFDTLGDRTNEHLFFASLLLLKQSRPISDLTFVPLAIQLIF